MGFNLAFKGLLQCGQSVQLLNVKLLARHVNSRL